MAGVVGVTGGKFTIAPLELAGQRQDIGGGGTVRMTYCHRRLGPDAVLDPGIAPDHAGQRRLDLEKGLAGAQQRGIGALAFGNRARHVHGDLQIADIALADAELDEGIGVSERGRLVGRDDQHAAGAPAKLADGALDAGAEVEQEPVVMGRRLEQLVAQLRQALTAHGDERCGAGTARHHVEIARRIIGDGIGQRAPALDHGSQIRARHQAELDVDIGEAEIAVEQQDAFLQPCQGLGQRDGEPGLPDTALARRNGKSAQTRRPAGGPRRGGFRIGAPRAGGLRSGERTGCRGHSAASLAG